MPAYWKMQLQNLIDLAEHRIREIESVVGDHYDAQRQIAAERAIVTRLQQTIDALNSSVSFCV